jgi:hypothetical protein
MATYTNFYETVKEANMRLRTTIVLYDGIPYCVMAICNHKTDGIFRIYLDPVSDCMDMYNLNGIPTANYPQDHPELGKQMDKWLDANPSTKIIRKMMNSPLFNKFRPFPLGMYNKGGVCSYVERRPTRKSEQGLTNNMISAKPIGLNNDSLYSGFEILSDAFKDTIVGNYPSIHETISQLDDPENGNWSVGFHRMFALVKGPLGTKFLAYKNDIVGVLTNGDLTCLRIGKDFRYLKETVDELNIFGEVYIR